MCLHVCRTLKTGMCTCTVAHNFGVRMQAREHMRDAHHKFDTLHMCYSYRYSSCRVMNNIAILQLIGFLICGNEHCLKVLLKRCGLTDNARISSRY